MIKIDTETKNQLIYHVKQLATALELGGSKRNLHIINSKGSSAERVITDARPIMNGNGDAIGALNQYEFEPIRPCTPAQELHHLYFLFDGFNETKLYGSRFSVFPIMDGDFFFCRDINGFQWGYLDELPAGWIHIPDFRLFLKDKFAAVLNEKMINGRTNPFLKIVNAHPEQCPVFAVDIWDAHYALTAADSEVACSSQQSKSSEVTHEIGPFNKQRAGEAVRVYLDKELAVAGEDKKTYRNAVNSWMKNELHPKRSAIEIRDGKYWFSEKELMNWYPVDRIEKVKNLLDYDENED